MTLGGRRALLAVAAALTLAAPAAPLWGFRMSARQYPGEALHLRVTTRGIEGDLQEVTTLQRYIGVRFPRSLPELRWVSPAIAALGLGLALAALVAGAGGWGRAASLAAFALLAAFLASSLVLLQVRLYAVGHDRDRAAPIRAIHDFTPPVLGPKKVGNFTVTSYPHLGGLALGMAGLLAFLAAHATCPLRRRASGGAGSPARPAALAGAGLALGLALLAPSPAAARTWTVGGPGSDFPLVAPALAAARDGDEVRVRAGVYREDLVLDRTVRLVGEGWPTLMGTGEGSVIEVRAKGCEVRGLAIEGSGAGESGRMDAGITVVGDAVRVAGNRMRRVFYGVVLAGVAGAEVVDNDIAGFRDLPFSRRGDGIYAYRSPGARLRRNRVSGERDGLYLQYAPDVVAEDNVVEACRYALHDMFSDRAAILRNAFRDSEAGANVMNSREVTLSGNTFERNRGVSAVGLSLKECDRSAVTGNVMRDNATGIKIDGAARNRFAGNRIAGNDHGVSLFASAEENVFTRNAFLRNGSDVVVRGRGSRTLWSEGGVGNYWDSYRGLDVDGDGRGESPHPILGPFEKLEGNNPATRVFLQSPAASALALAARFAPEMRGETSDPAPLVREPKDAAAPPPPGRAPLGTAAAGVGALVALAWRMECRPCSR